MLKVFWIEVVGSCNLRCPSCAVGNFEKSDFVRDVRSRGYMNFEYFCAILDKIEMEREPDDVCQVELYNWGEPFLHPNLARFIAEIRKRQRFRCGLSSNLSHKNADLERSLLAGPNSLRVSVSGFHQASYKKTHVRGDIELVKANMVRVSEIIAEHNLATVVTVAYHVYRHNAGEELEEMRRFCERLNFILTPNWANFYPLEKVVRYFRGHASAKEREIISQLVFTQEEDLEFAATFYEKPCFIRDQTAINYDGSVALCCALYDPSYDIAGDFLSTTASELQARKDGHAMCSFCIASNYHAMMCYYAMAEKDRQGAERIALADGWKIKANRLVRA
jgi:MoaA/NifB/PqqE/SkfB family radical SAM enzyme